MSNLLIRVASTIAPILIKKGANKGVEKEVRKATIKEIDQVIKNINKDIKNRTIIYCGFIVFTVLILYFKTSLPDSVILSLSLLLMICFLCIHIKPCKKLIRTRKFIKNFDNNIECKVKHKMETKGNDSFKNRIENCIKKVTLLTSGKNNTDIENLCISYSVRYIASQYKKYEFHIIVRIVTYFMISWLFQMIFLKRFFSLLGL